MKKCKWCEKELISKRSDAIFCRRACKNIYRRSIKNKLNKDEKVL